jgi:hypothetical protein
MVALAERLRLELDSSDRKNLVGSQIIPDKSATMTISFPPEYCYLLLTAKSFSNNCSDSLAPSSDNHTDSALVAGSEM